MLQVPAVLMEKAEDKITSLEAERDRLHEDNKQLGVQVSRLVTEISTWREINEELVAVLTRYKEYVGPSTMSGSAHVALNRAAKMMKK